MADRRWMLMTLATSTLLELRVLIMIDAAYKLCSDRGISGDLLVIWAFWPARGV